jgi:predicted Rossmann-fold nucleotide-binding protein
MLVSDAFIVMPGGVGTLLETAMVWQLLQVKKLYATPLILVGSMWCELVEWAKRTMSDIPSPLASAVDMTIPRCVPTVDDAIELIKADKACWKPG